MNKHGVSRRWFTEAYVKYFKGGWCIKNSHKYNQEYGKLKKKKKKNSLTSGHRDTEQLSKMQISLQVFFTDFVDRLGTTTLKMDFFWKILLIVSVTYSVFFGQTGTHIEPTKAPP